MDRRNNPYAPGAGLQPPELAGRDRLLADATTDMDRLLGKRPIKGMMLLGLRGVGKTVLLNRLYGIAEEKGIRTGKIEAPEGGALPQLLVPELRRILYALDLHAAAGHHLRRAAGALRNFVGAFKVKAATSNSASSHRQVAPILAISSRIFPMLLSRSQKRPSSANQRSPYLWTRCSI